MGKWMNQLSGADRLRRGMEKIIQESKFPEGVTLEGANGIMDTWGWTEECMRYAFKNGIKASACVVGGVAIGMAAVNVIDWIKKKVKKKKEEESEENEEDCA